MTTTLTNPAIESVTRPRSVERLVAGQPTSDGAGVKLTRVLTQPLQRRLDPFLMLDAFGTDNPQDYIGGFPDHPHRGFETVTYMIAGRMRHLPPIHFREGQEWVAAGQAVAVIEQGTVSIEVKSPFDAVVAGILVRDGEPVQPGQPLVWLESDR